MKNLITNLEKETETYYSSITEIPSVSNKKVYIGNNRPLADMQNIKWGFEF